MTIRRRELPPHATIDTNLNRQFDEPSKSLTMSQSSSKLKAGALWSKNKDDLTKQLGELKTELGQLRIQKIASSGGKLNKM